MRVSFFAQENNLQIDLQLKRKIHRKYFSSRLTHHKTYAGCLNIIMYAKQNV